MNLKTMKERNGMPMGVTVVLMLAAMALCAFGVWRGEVLTVLNKAINICMECIGLG